MNTQAPSRNRWRLALSLFFSMNLLSAPVFPHGEEIHVTQGVKGPVKLNPEQKKSLQIQSVHASIQPLAQLLTLNGQIQLLPNAQADVSVRISGNIVSLDANLGDNVQKGQRLATIQSRLVGNPPPSVGVDAPIAGIIDARNVNLGQSVEPNTVLFHISNRDTLLILAKVYEEDLSKVTINQDVSINVLSYPEEVFVGKVILIEPNLDVRSRTVTVQISVANKDNRLKPGMFVRAHVILNKNAKALTIPNTALLEANGESFVFVEKGDTYERVLVTVGARDEKNTEITSGLAPGDEVITQGNRQLYTLWLSGSQPATPNKDHH